MFRKTPNCIDDFVVSWGEIIAQAESYNVAIEHNLNMCLNAASAPDLLVQRKESRWLFLNSAMKAALDRRRLAIFSVEQFPVQSQITFGGKA